MIKDTIETYKPKEMKKFLNKLDLLGRTIVDISTVSYDFSHSADNVMDTAEYLLRHLPEEQRLFLSDYKNIPGTLRFPRSCTIDYPFMLRFQDGNVLGLEAHRNPWFAAEWNSGGWTPKNDRNIELRKLFAPCLNRRIVNVEIKTFPSSGVPTHWGDIDRNEPEVLDAIVLWLDNDTGIEVSVHIDYTVVDHITRSGEVTTLPFSSLKKALCNSDEIHDDPSIGYSCRDNRLFAGCNAHLRVSTPAITVRDTATHASVMLSEEDFSLFVPAFEFCTGLDFSCYEDYILSYPKWKEILEETLRRTQRKTGEAKESSQKLVLELQRWSSLAHSPLGKIQLVDW